ncbi:MAG: DUF4097 domain-containing protein [Lachnospiraceae bacterium]|nr:DUF4097 domain-containing protein [Lachnospiraceae bacterium]
MTSFEKIVKYTATAFAALLAVGIVVGILQGILFLIGIIGGNYGKTIDSSQSFEAKQVRNIQIESSVGDIRIFETDGDKILIEGKKVSERFTCELGDEGTIVIRNKNTGTFIFNLFRHSPSIYIYIPKNVKLDVVEMELGVGDLRMEQLKAAELNVDNGVGDIRLTDCEILSSEYDLGIGDIRMENCKMGDIKAENGIGDVRLELEGDIDNYEIEIDNGIGDNEINGENRKNYETEKAKYEISCDSGIGDVKINIRK